MLPLTKLVRYPFINPRNNAKVAIGRYVGPKKMNNKINLSPITTSLPKCWYSTTSSSSLINKSPLLKAKDRKKISESDLMALSEYSAERRTTFFDLKKVIKKHRLLLVGPFASITFENYDLMWLQVHDMLLTEGGNPDQTQIQDELDAYNPLVPQGHNLAFTLMFELSMSPEKRVEVLKKLGRVEDEIALRYNNWTIKATSVDGHEMERTTDDGKTSAVHFLKFDFTEAQKKDFLERATKESGNPVIFAIEHPNYQHMTVLSQDILKELSKDFF